MRTGKLNKSFLETKNNILKRNADKLAKKQVELAYLEYEDYYDQFIRFKNNNK